MVVGQTQFGILLRWNLLKSRSPTGARTEAPKALRLLPVLRKPFRLEQVLGFLREPVLPFWLAWRGLRFQGVSTLGQ